MAGFKSFNVKKVPKSGWLLIGCIILIMVLALIFEPSGHEVIYGRLELWHVALIGVAMFLVKVVRDIRKG